MTWHIAFARTGAPNSRSCQLFVNFANNHRLDHDGFTPFGKVVDSDLKALDVIHVTGEGAPAGN